MDDVKRHYEKLYRLQDEVLEIVFDNSNEFYLTGGTCLSRFYKAFRYSDDLDLFTNFSSRYSLELKTLKQELSKKFDLSIEVESQTFTRFLIDKELQIDFVNDNVKRCGKVLQKDKILIDNIENILSNKLTAIIGRDNAKDVFDLYMIDKFYKPDYKKAIKCAKEKMFFELGDLIYRLKTFPNILLKDIKLIQKNFLDDFNLQKIIDKIKEVEV